MTFQHFLLLSITALSLTSGQNLSLLTSNSSFLPNAITEWTAMGDSYASGIGAGDLPQGPDPDKCFRCSSSYPEIMQSGQGSLRPNPDIFNFVACSGATFPEILRYQLNDLDRPGRPSWGNAPEFVTLTMGGNDVGILSLVLTCIYSIRIRAVGCDTLLQQGFDILDSDEFGEGIANVIRTVRDQGRRQYANFHIFVTGYAQLFNSETTQCNGVTFSLGLLPRQYLTQDRRRRMNKLADELNFTLFTVVRLLDFEDVTYVDYDNLFEGHRICDRFEPNPNDDETWFFQRGTTSDPTTTDGQEVTVTNEGENAITQSMLNKTFPNAAELIDNKEKSLTRPFPINDSRVDTIPTMNTVNGNLSGGENAPFMDYFRVFHPKSRAHQAIRIQVIQAINRVQLSRMVAARPAVHDIS